jgi:hypothetical protein
MRNKRAVSSRPRLIGAAAATSLILIVTVTACSGSASSSSAVLGMAAPAASAAPSAAAAGPNAQNGFAASGGTPASAAVKYTATGEQLIYTAQLTVRAANVSAALSQATSIVSAAGGYVSGENASAGNGKPSQATATVTFKIPVTAYAATLAALSGRGLGTQLSLAQQAQDVTQQVADVSSRVTSDEDAITQLRSLLAHAGNVSSLLSVQDQINSEESDLESMLAQQSALNHETSYATVTVTLVGPQAAVKPPAKAAPPPGFARALSGGAHALHVTVSWLLTVLGAVAPFAAVVIVVGGLAWWGRRRFSRRRRPTDHAGTA